MKTEFLDCYRSFGRKFGRFRQFLVSFKFFCPINTGSLRTRRKITEKTSDFNRSTAIFKLVKIPQNLKSQFGKGTFGKFGL